MHRLQVGDAPPFVGDAVVKGGGGALDLAQAADDAEGEGEDDDFVEGLEEDLVDHQRRYHHPGEDAAEGEGEEDSRVDAFAEECADDGAEREAFVAVAELHPAHDVGVDHGAAEEGGEAGAEHAGDCAVDGLHGGLGGPFGGAGEEDAGLEEQHDQQIGGEAEPYHQAGLAEAVDLDHAVVDDVGDGKDDEPCRQLERAELDGFDFHEVADDEADAEEHRQGYEQG